MLPSTAQLRQTGGRELKRIVFDEETIAERVRELGREITDAYPAGDLLVLGLLKGSFIFLSDLVRRIERPLQVDFLVASSYGEGTVSSGDVRESDISSSAPAIRALYDSIDDQLRLAKNAAICGSPVRRRSQATNYQSAPTSRKSRVSSMR